MVGTGRVSDWPTTDDKGRLRFASEPVHGRARARRARALPRPAPAAKPAAARRRCLRGAHGSSRPRPPEGWIEPPVHDVTADARRGGQDRLLRGRCASSPSRRKRWLAPSPVPSDHFTVRETSSTTSRPKDLVYFLRQRRRRRRATDRPPRPSADGRRRALVVDVGSRRKLPAAGRVTDRVGRC